MFLPLISIWPFCARSALFMTRIPGSPVAMHSLNISILGTWRVCTCYFLEVWIAAFGGDMFIDYCCPWIILVVERGSKNEHPLEMCPIFSCVLSLNCAKPYPLCGRFLLELCSLELNFWLFCAAAYKQADGRKIDNRRVLVDVERGRTVPNWRPRRLGGGLGSTRVGGDEVNQKYSGR